MICEAPKWLNVKEQRIWNDYIEKLNAKPYAKHLAINYGELASYCMAKCRLNDAIESKNKDLIKCYNILTDRFAHRILGEVILP